MGLLPLSPHLYLFQFLSFSLALSISDFLISWSLLDMQMSLTLTLFPSLFQIELENLGYSLDFTDSVITQVTSQIKLAFGTPGDIQSQRNFKNRMTYSQ